MAQLRKPVVEPLYVPSPRAEYHSRALGTLLSELPRDRRISILDLGAAVSTNVELYSNFASKIYIEDFYQSIKNGELFDYTTENPISSLLPFKEEAKVDVILCWDLLNYLSRYNLQRFLDYLQSFCKPGTLLLTFFYINHDMPEHASHFRVAQNPDLRSPLITVEQTCNSSYRSPRYTQADISKIAPQLRVLCSYVQRSGFREELYVVS